MLEFGVNCVIVVNEDVKIKDSIATKLGTIFYEKLVVESMPIQEAYEASLEVLRTNDSLAAKCQSCCCDHEHEPDCKWYALISGEKPKLTSEEVIFW